MKKVKHALIIDYAWVHLSDYNRKSSIHYQKKEEKD